MNYRLLNEEVDRRMKAYDYEKQVEFAAHVTNIMVAFQIGKQIEFRTKAYDLDSPWIAAYAPSTWNFNVYEYRIAPLKNHKL